MASATEAHRDAEAEHLEYSSSAERRVGALVAGTYRITRQIGAGGSSHVFEAEHVRLGKLFALKLLRPELDTNRRTAKRFRREARAIARLNSEHIVSVVDCGELDDGAPYLVMELVAGEDLRSLLNREGSLPTRRAVHLIIEACRGLNAVHEAGLVHRDIKPENLFVTRRSTGEDWCKVLDFGVARIDSSLSTAEHAIVGTVRYMAPEQLADSAAVGVKTDVYALGAILYECLSGRALVAGSTVQEVMYRIMNTEPVPLSELAPTLPRALAQVVERCLRKSPAARPSSADELARLLRAAVGETAARAAANDTLAEDDASRPAPPRRRGTLSIAAVALAASSMAAFIGWYARGAWTYRTGEQTIAARVAAPPAARGTPTVDTTRPLANAAPAESRPVTTPASASSTTMPSASATRPATTAPRLVASAAPRAPAVSRFDSTNPYAE